jgi:hypothetical protein
MYKLCTGAPRRRGSPEPLPRCTVGWTELVPVGSSWIRNFAHQLRQDILTVEAAVTEKWSNGPVEGQVNQSIG